MSNYRSTAFSAPNMAAVDQAAAAAAAAAGRPSPSKVASPAADFGAPRSWPVDEPVYKSVGVAAYAPSAPSFGAFDDGEKTVYRSMQHHETYRSMELDEHVADASHAGFDAREVGGEPWMSDAWGAKGGMQQHGGAAIPSLASSCFAPLTKTVVVAAPAGDVARVSRPPACPMFIEPNHYYSTQPAGKLRDVVLACCHELLFDPAVLDDDVHETATHWSVPFTTYVQHASVDFWVSIYVDDKSSGPTERFLLEVQRRSGDGYAFCEAVRGLKGLLDREGVLETPPAGANKASWAAKAQAAAAKRAAAVAAAQERAKANQAAAAAAVAASEDALSTGDMYRSLQAGNDAAAAAQRGPRAPFKPVVGGCAQGDPALPCAAMPAFDAEAAAADSVAHVLHLAKSPYEDVRAEAARALADLAAQPLAQRALLASACSSAASTCGVGVLLNALTAAHKDEHRCAAAALANLLHAPSATHVAEARARVGVEGARRLLALIAATRTPQVLREAARALVGYGADDLRGESSLQASRAQALQILSEHRCALVQAYARSLQ